MRALFVALLISLILASTVMEPVNAQSAMCSNKCKARCSKAGVEDRCLKYCNICCLKCKCVPSGTYGNKHQCPCYRDLKNSKATKAKKKSRPFPLGLAIGYIFPSFPKSSCASKSNSPVSTNFHQLLSHSFSSTAMATTPHTILLKTPPLFSNNKIHHTRNLTNIRKNVIRCSTSTTVARQSASTDRVFNFAAGPAVLPEIVLEKAQSELLNWGGSGMSVMEMSHRGKEFTSIIDKAESDLRSLLNIPTDDYAVLFLQGGATSQFSAVPLNLCTSPEDPVDYLVTGSWGDKAAKEASKYSSVSTVWSGKSDNYVRIPDFDAFSQNPGARYLHICANETIYGVEFKDYPVPRNKDGILVADMSSNFCSKPVDVTKFGVIYAGAQKNVGPAGVTIVIVRRDLIGKSQKNTPIMLDYKIHSENKSLYNTPPCFGIYMCGLVFEDLLQQGGLAEVEKKNLAKAQLLYDAIDNSGGFFRCPVEKSVRSLMNVPFTLAKSELEGEFIKQAAQEKMVALKGHRSVGGMRASLYNAMPLAGVKKLVAFMKDFQARHG